MNINGFDRLRIILMSGTGDTTTNITLTNANAPRSMALAGAADLNGDCNNDILWQSNGTASVFAWLMTGTNLQMIGTNVLKINLPDGPGAGWGIAGIGDLNNDGKMDLVWTNGGGEAQIELIEGTNSVLAILPPVPDTSWRIIGAWDLNPA